MSDSDDQAFVSWRARIEGVELDAILIDVGGGGISTGALWSDGEGEVVIRFNLERPVEEAAVTKAGVLAERLLDQIAFRFSCSVGERRLEEIRLPATGTSDVEMRSQAVADSYIEAVVVPSKEQLSELKSLLERAVEKPDELSLRLYRIAISQSEPVTRFMLLYHLLLHVCDGGPQWAVDMLIRSIEPSVAMKRTGKANKPGEKGEESVFTRLRNEIGHSREGVNMEETIKEIRLNVGQFQEIVRVAISPSTARSV